MHVVPGIKNEFIGHSAVPDDFCNGLGPAAIEDLRSMELVVDYTGSQTLFVEMEPARKVYLILEGEVKLSINSSEGRRLCLRIARKGEILGLASAFSGGGYEATAETLRTARVAALAQAGFLEFLARHPEVYRPVTETLSRELRHACGQLRKVGLAVSAHEKVARLLLDLSATGQRTQAGTRFRCYLTHQQIGELVGNTRETVTRILGVFKHRGLVLFQGSMVMIPSPAALKEYVGVPAALSGSVLTSAGAATMLGRWPAGFAKTTL